MFPQQVSPVRVLHVDDDEAFLELSREMIEHVHDRVVVESVVDAESALARLDAGGIDCVVTDYQMEGMDGLVLLTAMRDAGVDIPVVFFTGKGSEEIASEAIAAGVTDYLQKGTDKAFLLLGNRVITLVEKYRSEKAAREAADHIRQVYERISEAFLALDTDWHVTYLNSHAEELLQCSSEDVLDTPLWEAFPALAEGTFGEALRKASTEQSPRSFETTYDPLDRWLSVVVYPAEDGLSMFVRDVTDYKRAEAELVEMRDRVESAESQFRTLREKVSRPAAPFR